MNLFSNQKFGACKSVRLQHAISRRLSSIAWLTCFGTLLTSLILSPQTTLAADHGASIQKQVVNLTPPRAGTTNVAIGDTLFVTITVRNFDSFGDTQRI